MTKAQEVRERRLEAIKNDYFTESEKIFSWILDLIDQDTKKKVYGTVSICIFEDESEINTMPVGKKAYQLSNFLLTHDKLQLFSTLKDLIDKEEGYRVVNFQPNTTYYDVKAMTLEISVQ